MTGIPVHVLTGFLGSGKTTLLRAMLADPALADTVVLINEFGAIGLDHLLVEALDETTVLLQSGCICCTIRDDLSTALADLQSRRAQGLIPAFERVVVETTGLADPVPILATIRQHPMLRHHFRIGMVIATIDGVLGLGNLDDQPELAKQAAVADRLVLTKADIAEPADLMALRARLGRMNPTAELVVGRYGALDAGALLVERDDGRDPSWLGRLGDADGGHYHAAGHTDGIEAYCITLDAPVDWCAFGIWLSLLLHRHGDRMLRVKGILNVERSETPVAVHGVQHLVHPPTHLAAWPSDDHRSRLVLIGRGFETDMLRRSLQAVLRLGAPVTA